MLPHTAALHGAARARARRRASREALGGARRPIRPAPRAASPRLTPRPASTGSAELGLDADASPEPRRGDDGRTRRWQHPGRRGPSRADLLSRALRRAATLTPAGTRRQPQARLAAAALARGPSASRCCWRSGVMRDDVPGQADASASRGSSGRRCRSPTSAGPGRRRGGRRGGCGARPRRARGRRARRRWSTCRRCRSGGGRRSGRPS